MGQCNSPDLLISLFYPHIPLSRYHFLGTHQSRSQGLLFFRTRDMDHRPESDRFKALFEHALEIYEKKTGVSLTHHPLAIKLQNCDPVEAITDILQDQARAFGDLQGSDKIMESIKTTVSILSKLSSAASLVDPFGLVRQQELVARFISLTVSYSYLNLRKRCKLVSLSYLMYVPFSGSYEDGLGDIRIMQAAKGIISNCDTLVDLLESIEHFLSRLDIYTRIPPTPAINEIVVKILAELISTLGLVTEELKQRRSSKFVVANILLLLTAVQSSL